MNFYDPDKAVFCSKPASIQNSIDIASDNWVTFFQKLGVLNDGFADLYPDFRINWLNKQFDNLTGKSVLELGSLEGAHTLQYEELGCSDVIGIESNEAHFMKSLLIKNAAASSNIQFLLGDFSSYLKNCKRRFDLISACGVLYHMINPMEIIGSCSMISDTIFIWTVIYNKKWICNHGVKAMSKNKVQFQAGYSLIQLFQDYGTESQCREALFKLR
ncbi:MAG: class I SAM-dependent methyltransferase, partial [Methylococcales bacterium]